MKLFKLFIVAAVSIGFVGCIKVDQTLNINSDGSGSLSMSYSMQESMIQQMEAMAAMDGEENGDTDFDFDEENVKKELGQLEEHGITVKSVKSEVKDGWRTMNIELEFEDIAQLTKTDFYDEETFRISKNEAGNYVIQTLAEEMDHADEEMSAAMMQSMAPMFAGMRIAQHINVPGDIVKSNATKVDGQTASWIYDIDEDPTVIQKMQKMTIELEFDGSGVDIKGL